MTVELRTHILYYTRGLQDGFQISCVHGGCVREIEICVQPRREHELISDVFSHVGSWRHDVIMG